MARRNNRADIKSLRRAAQTRHKKRTNATGDKLTYCVIERDKQDLKRGGYTNPAPKLRKVRYNDRKSASRVLEARRQAGHEETRVYRCGRCKGYHLTKQPKRDFENGKFIRTEGNGEAEES